MSPAQLLSALAPLLRGFAIDAGGLTPALSYELQVGGHTLFLAIEASGRVLLATRLPCSAAQDDARLAWALLNANSLDQPEPTLIHSVSRDQHIILWCDFSLHALSSDALQALPQRFLTRLLQTCALAEDATAQAVKTSGPAQATATQNRDALFAAQLQEKLRPRG